MDSVFRIENNRLVRVFDSEKLWIEPWGPNSLRIRTTHMSSMLSEDWALLPQEECRVNITVKGQTASIVNGKIKADISAGGKITFYNQKGDLLLQEYVRNRKNINEFCILKKPLRRLPLP